VGRKLLLKSDEPRTNVIEMFFLSHKFYKKVRLKLCPKRNQLNWMIGSSQPYSVHNDEKPYSLTLLQYYVNCCNKKIVYMI